MPVYISDIMQDFAKNVRKILGNSLDSVIVYGSYARGDYSELSDVDVMLLVSLKEEEIKRISDQISDLAFDFMIKYGVDISSGNNKYRALQLLGRQSALLSQCKR